MKLTPTARLIARLNTELKLAIPSTARVVRTPRTSDLRWRFDDDRVSLACGSSIAVTDLLRAARLGCLEQLGWTLIVVA